jgi:hypothetical protein
MCVGIWNARTGLDPFKTYNIVQLKHDRGRMHIHKRPRARSRSRSHTRSHTHLRMHTNPRSNSFSLVHARKTPLGASVPG